MRSNPVRGNVHIGPPNHSGAYPLPIAPYLVINFDRMGRKYAGTRNTASKL